MNMVKFSLARELSIRSVVSPYLMLRHEEKMLDAIIKHVYRGRLTHLVYMLFKGSSLGYRSPWDLSTDEYHLFFDKLNVMSDFKEHRNMTSFFDDLITIPPDDVISRYTDVLNISELEVVLRFFESEFGKELMKNVIDDESDIYIESYYLLFKVLTAFENEFILPALEDSFEKGEGRILYMRNRVNDIDLITL